MAHIHKKTVIHAPFADVVPSAVNSHPDAWPQWYLGLSAPTEVKGNGEVGTISKHDFLVAGRRFPLTHEVVESDNDGTVAHWKGTFKGPIEGWHRWTYHLVNGNTEVEVEHEYKLPAGPIGELADKVFVERMIDRMLEQSVHNLKMLMEAPVGAA
jgi:hypothetical protein